MIPPKRFDIFPLTGGCSEGLDAFRFFFKQLPLLKLCRSKLKLSNNYSCDTFILRYSSNYNVDVRNVTV